MVNVVGWRDLLVLSYEPMKDSFGKYLIIEVLILSDRERGQIRKIEVTNGPVSQQLLASVFQEHELINLGVLAQVDLWDIAYLLFERKFSGLLTLDGHFREYRRYK